MTPCEVCGEQAVASDAGKMYCMKHHQMWCKCITHEKMVAEHQKEFGELKKDSGARK